MPVTFPSLSFDNQVSPDIVKGPLWAKVTLHLLTPLSFVVAGTFSHLVKSYTFFRSLLDAPIKLYHVFPPLDYERPKDKAHVSFILISQHPAQCLALDRTQ